MSSDLAALVDRLLALILHLRDQAFPDRAARDRISTAVTHEVGAFG
jgi:hypothetical protein